MSSAASEFDFKYAAFISYRHMPQDRQWAVWLHNALETYRVPQRLVQSGAPLRLGRVFRDEEEVAASADLSATIEAALRQSKYLIVVCSPAASSSAWVNREIELFRELGRDDQILSLLIDGEPGEAFPPALLSLRDSPASASGAAASSREPLAADGRPRPGERPGTIRRTALLRLVATILDVSFDSLRQREHERAMRRALSLSMSALALLAVVSALGLFAWVQRHYALTVAQANEQLADDKGALLVEERRQAEIRLVRSGMELVDSGDLYSALPWLAEGMLKAGPERGKIHRVRLAAVLHQAPHLISMQFFDRPVFDVEFSPDSSKMLIVAGDAHLQAVDQPEQAKLSVSMPGGISGASFESGGDRILTWSNSLSRDRGGVRLWSGTDGTALTPHLNVGRPIAWAQVSPDGLLIAARGNAPENFYGLAVNEVASGKAVESLFPGETAPTYVRWSPDGNSVFAAGHEQVDNVHRSYGRLWHKREGKFEVLHRVDQPLEVNLVSFSASGDSIALRLDEGKAQVVDCASGQDRGPQIMHGRRIVDLQLDPNGRRLLTVCENNRAFSNSEAERVDGEAVVWEVASGKPLSPPLRHDGEDVFSAEFSQEAELVATRSSTQARVWRTATGLPVAPPLRHRAGLNDVALSGDGRYVVTAGQDGTARLYDLSTTGCIPFSPDVGSGRFIGSRGARFVTGGSPLPSTAFGSCEPGTPSRSSLSHRR